MASRNQTKEDVLLNKEEAAARLGIAENYVGVAVKKSTILAEGQVKDVYPGSKIPRWRIKSSAIDAYLASGEAGQRKARAGGLRKAIKFVSREQMAEVDQVLQERWGLKLEVLWAPRNKQADSTTTNGASTAEAVASDQAPPDYEAEDYEDDKETEDELGEDEGEQE